MEEDPTDDDLEKREPDESDSDSNDELWWIIC